MSTITLNNLSDEEKDFIQKQVNDLFQYKRRYNKELLHVVRISINKILMPYRSMALIDDWD